jgi:hypothetical protein
LPVRILYPSDYLPTPNAVQSALIDKFVEILESALQVSTRTKISLLELWKEQCPDGPKNADIAEYLKLVYHPINPLELSLNVPRQEAILTTETHTTTCLTSEMTTPRNMENHPSRTEPCNGNGELTVPRRMIEKA